METSNVDSKMAVVEPESTLKERRHSTTPSDVLEVSGASMEDSIAKKEYQDALTRDRLLRLEALEGRFSNFTKFIQQKDLKRSNRPRVPVQQDSNNNQQAVRSRRKTQHKTTVDRDEIVHFTESPSFIKGEMRPYQVEGLNWLVSLYENRLNGILADEMGLGKTLQSISILEFLNHYKKINGPHVIIVPLSTIANWQREFKRFAPDIRVLHGHCLRDGKKDFHRTLTASRRNWDVVVTAYHFFVSEFHYFKQVNFQYVIVDEAQRCKNERSQLAKCLRQTTYRNMLFLTGTPINNNLHELWALLNLLLPDIFKDSEDFDDWFKVEDCIDPNHERAVRLKNILQPIVLRRIKAEVEIEIPPKIKTMLFIPPTRQMNYWSKRVLHRDVPVLKGDGSFGNMRFATVFPFLRQVTLHPYLIPGIEPDDNLIGQHLIDVSSRMIVLDKLLAKLKARGSRVLLFTQFVIMLNILDDYCAWKGYEYMRMTGDTISERRQDMIDQFNAPDSNVFIFMITTRTGGVGINLHTADTVIFFDIDWNPQADFQAEDRAHRIGQKKQVHVIRFCVSGTVDEYLQNCSNRKQALDKAIIKKSLSDSVKQGAVALHKSRLESANCLEETSVDPQLDEMFAEIDRGERNAQNDNLFKEVHLKAKPKRSPSEERELDSVKPPPVDPVEEIDWDSVGYRYRFREAKKHRVDYAMLGKADK